MANGQQTAVYPNYGTGLGGGINKTIADASQGLNTAKTAVVQAKGIISTVKGLLGLTSSAPQTSFNKDSGTAFLCGRGTVYQVPLVQGNNGSAGYYAIKEWSDMLETVSDPTSQDASLPPDATLAPVLFTGMRIGQRDVVGRVLCMDNIKVLYTYGQNFGDVTIGGEILLGNFNDRQRAQDTLKTFTDFFWKNRVSVSLAPVTVSVLSETHLVYLEGVDFGEIDLQYHVMPFILYGTLLDLSRDVSFSKNNSGLVLTTTNIQDSAVTAALSATTGLDTSVSGIMASQSDSASAPILKPTTDVPPMLAATTTDITSSAGPTPSGMYSALVDADGTPRAGITEQQKLYLEKCQEMTGVTSPADMQSVLGGSDSILTQSQVSDLQAAVNLVKPGGPGAVADTSPLWNGYRQTTDDELKVEEDRLRSYVIDGTRNAAADAWHGIKSAVTSEVSTAYNELVRAAGSTAAPAPSTSSVTVVGDQLMRVQDPATAEQYTYTPMQ